MKRIGLAGMLCLVLAVAAGSGCLKGPDPWSPKTYPLEVKPYCRDRGALGPQWKKYEIEGMEDVSFFYANDSLEAVISVTFTCGKYQDITLPQLASHLIIPMGREAEVIRSGYVSDPRVDVYHLRARGTYQYHKETLYKDLGLVPDLRAPMMIDAYVIGEPHCVVDIVYVVPPEKYEAGLSDFHSYLRSLRVPVDEEEGTGG